MIPSDVLETGAGTYYRTAVVDGVPRNSDVCEDCWRDIPRYVDFPRGLVSPESSGDAGGNFAKTRKINLPTSAGPKESVEHLQKVVCLPCYFMAFRRVYPNAEHPLLSGAIR